MKPVVFKWSNKDVLAWLNQLKNRTMKLKDVEAKIFSEYGWKVSKPTISRHLPKEEQKLIIIAINTKFGGAMTAVLEESNLYSLYKLKKKSEESNYFICLRCEIIRNDLKKSEPQFMCPSLTELVATRQYRTNGATHHKNCKKFTENEVIALDLNRKMREEVKTEVTSLPMATFEKYEKIALEMSKKKQENVTHPLSIAMKFPTYEEVRYQLGRARRAGVLNVEDPFELPNAYTETLANERWELLSDRLAGVALFSSDRSLQAAAKCKYLAVDATFEVCPKSFRQLLTIHGLFPGKNGDEWVSLAFALMKTKNAASYEIIFQSIKQAWKRMSVEPVFRLVLMDFEDAEVKAVIGEIGLESTWFFTPSGYSRLFNLLHTIEYQQSRRISKIAEGCRIKPKSRKYKQVNEKLEQYWDRYEEKSKKSRESIQVLSVGNRFLRKAAELVSDVGGSGLRTVKAEKVATNRKRALSDPVAVKKSKKTKVSALIDHTTSTIDLTGSSSNAVFLFYFVFRFSELGLRMIDTFYAESSPILVNNFGIQLKKSDIDRLDPGNCLNDVVVNYYLQLLVEENKSKVFAFPTQFFPKLTRESPAAMLNWFTGPSLFCHEIILLPIHTPGHWSLAVIQVKRQRIDYYDSMSGDGSEYIEIIKEYMFLKAKSMNMDQTNLDDWIGFNQKRIPQQTNGHDCGVFLCCFAKCTSRKSKPNFSQEQMLEIRSNIKAEILTGKLTKKS
uniref:Ubiquitin-like protease family profile domain-containing protein n=1 Tax=Ditylenchus dipsaci TaxID=166011 RepID=A0A915ERY4_9BILA